jgi:hypothetical protein
MVASYFVAGDSFRAEKPTFWSDIQLLDLGAFTRNFVLHPDGKRIAILRSPGAETQSLITKVTFIFNFFGEIRSKFVP